MYFLLFLFFGSLFGITFMIGRKLIVLQGGEVVHHNENLLKDSYEEWRRSAVRIFRKYSYLGLVVIVRFYVYALNFLKKKYIIVKTKVKEIIAKKLKHKEERTEPSKFLKMMSEYKHKIRKIRHQIKEEEDL